ncbi:hypothetical protein [Methylophilus sp. QUAN]|uniref:hypothetical protein n=1 Tax=Methylophilus sp. QUAN TaxID=2781020 RepID=UPI00188F8488|nr:hypothetical protein [Methylophilus sp. QUAN]MBF4991024.1 hypothetical protein [Methylophilus sp. QUAN]
MKFLKFIFDIIPSLNRLKAIDEVLHTNNRGIVKRIDEGRELLELLQEKCPGFLEEHFWVEGWIESNDRFLMDLATAAKKTHLFKPKGMRPFPRPWPGKA